MKLILIALACFVSVAGMSQKDTATQKKPAYEMKQYWFVMLTKGKDRDKITDTAQLNKLQAGHMANMGRLVGLGKLNVAGPFGDD
eukprot:gene48283-65502_t